MAFKNHYLKATWRQLSCGLPRKDEKRIRCPYVFTNQPT